MSRAINSQTQVAYIKEVTENVTPATPAFQLFRATGEGINVDRTYKTASELTGQRGEKTSVIASAAGSGKFDFEFTAATLEAFLEAALRSTWATNVLTDANVPSSFTLETRFEAGTVDLYKRLTGAQVSALSLELKAADLATGSVDFMARGGDFANAIVAGATYTAGNTETVQVGANVASLALAGLTLDVVTGLKMTINNNTRQQYGLGSLSPLGVAAGKLQVTGSLDCILSDTQYALLRAHADGTPTGLTFQIGSAANKNTKFEMPNILITDIKINSTSADGDVMISASYTALQAATLANAVIRVTRGL